jgi:hypothetical protein
MILAHIKHTPSPLQKPIRGNIIEKNIAGYLENYAKNIITLFANMRKK